MAGSGNGNSEVETNVGIPSNEEIINSLASELEKSVIKDVSAEEVDSKQSDTLKTSNEGTDENDVLNRVQSDNDDNLEFHDSVDDVSDIKSDKSDDYIDEVLLKDLEVGYSEEDKKRLQKEATEHKLKGNEQFKNGEYSESCKTYTQALRICPLAFDKDRAMLYSNRAAAKMKLDQKEGAIEDCTKAVELDDRYLKAYFRRAQLYEATDKLDEALADYKKIIELDPLHRDALYATKRLPDQIQERNEKLKAEMLGKLKELGNMVLRPFGLSTDNFQMVQDPNSGGYSINFKQNQP